MNRFGTVLLAAAVTAGVPAIAFAQQAPDQGGHEHHHDGGGAPGGGQGGQGGRPPQTPPQPAPQAPQQPRPQPQAQAAPQQPAAQFRPQDQDQRRMGQGMPNRPAFGDHVGGFTPQNRPDGNPDARAQQAPGYGNWRGGDQRGGPPPGGNYRPQQAPGYGDRGAPPPPNARPDQRGYAGGWNRPGGPDGRGGPGFGGPGWRGFDWRQDRRYDWRGYRDAHREIFRARPYMPPAYWAYGYRRFEVGYQLPPYLYTANYWIDDPWDYRLPPVDGPYRWVRYYNDVLLIDLNTGEVVDEIPDFFW